MRKGKVMRIGVFGATGEVGKGVLKVLAQEKYQVIAYYRTPRKAYELKRIYYPKIDFEQIDLQRMESIELACEKCDILINCAGPASEILDRIACVCIQKRKLYVDVAGGRTLRQKIELDYKTYNRGCCVLGAGIYPGLTEVFASAIAKSQSFLKELRMYFYGNSSLSENAAYDIVAGMTESASGMSYLRDGKVLKTTGNEIKDLKAKAPFDELVIMPVLNSEFCEMVFKRKIPTAYFYQSFFNEKALMDFIMIKALEKYKTVEQKKESAKKIQELLYSPSKDREIILLVEYITTEKKGSKKWVQFWSDEDWSLMTGYVAGLVATEMAKKMHTVQGVFYLGEMENVEKILERLTSFCKITISKGNN